MFLRCINILHFFVLVLLFGATSLCLLSKANAEPQDASSRIQKLFDSLHTSGDALNSGGGRAAGLNAASSLCQELMFGSQKDLFISSLLSQHPNDTAYLSTLREIASQKLDKGLNDAQSSLCARLTGQEVTGINFGQEAQSILRQDLAPALIETGRTLGEQHGIPFLSRLEVGIGSEGRSLVSSISSVQPLWEDATSQHHVFAQASYYTTSSEKNNKGFAKAQDTVNLGVAYRHLTPDKKYLYGTNVFIDHAPKSNHNRLSLGVDARTSQLAFAANKYIPLSDWKKLDDYYEEKAAGGFDLNLRGQVPNLPSWTGSLTTYQWDEQDDGRDLYGAVGTLEYSPVPALAVRIGIRDESQASPSLEAGLRFAYRFDQSADLQWKERKSLAPVSDYVYEKVERQNLIRTKQQRRAESKVSVLETIGANSATEETGSRSLQVGQTLLMPVTITVGNTVGAVARVRLADGSILTAGQNTQVRIEPTLITLISGVIHYASNGAIETVIVPGGMITLRGTDIDVVGSGSTSSVRVRDGEVDFVGSSSGSETLSPGDAAKSNSGVVGSIALGSTDYISHTDTVSSEIDRVADPIVGPGITPYPFEPPRVISDVMNVGGNIVFGLRFTSPVTVSGGTPRLVFTISGTQRTATYSGGSGTSDLQFAYTNVIADISALSLTVNSFDLNGASVIGNGKLAVTTIADKTLAVTGTGDITPPSGYSVSWTTSFINLANQASGAFNITSAEVGADYSYTITSSGGAGSVAGSGTAASSTVNLTGLNLSALPDGTLTASVSLTDTSGNTSTAGTSTITKDTVVPAVISVGSPPTATTEP